MKFNINNISTIYTYVLVTFSGWFIGYLGSKGLNLGVDAETLAQLIGAVIGFILANINAKNPNEIEFLGNGSNNNSSSVDLDDSTA